MTDLHPGLDSARTILERARASYPAPFSILASELLFELSTPAPDWGRVFLLQIDLFEASVAFLSFVQLAELDRRKLPIDAATESVVKLREGAKLSSGHWWAMLRATSQDVRKSAEGGLLEPARIASSLYFSDETGGAARGAPAFAKLLDAVPNLRNRVKGHAWTLPPEQYAEHARSLLETTSAFLRALSGLEGCATFVVAQCTARGEEDFEIDARFLEGDARRPTRRTLKSKVALSPNRVLLARRGDLEGGALLFVDLHPFVQLRKGGDATEGLYLLQALEPKLAELASVAGGARLTCAESVAEAVRRLDSLLSRRSDKRGTGLEALRSRAKELAVALLASPAASASYDARTYLARPRLAQQLDTIEQGVGTEGAGQTRLWLMSAASGSGKTALACHSVERWLSAGRREELVVVALASELLAAGGSLTSWWQQRFGVTPLASCQTAHDAQGSVRLFIDGLDRLVDPALVLEELAVLIGDPAALSLRVVATATENVADQAFDSLREKGVGDLVHRWSMPPLTPDEARRLYELLSADGSGTPAPKLSSEVETLLTSPLLVRLARSLGKQEAAAGLTPGRLLRAHADRTVLADPVRAHVALRLVERILESRKKSIPLSELLDDPTLRSSLLASGEDAPLRTLVREHVLLLDRAPSPGGLPVPSEAQLSFAFDAQLDYLAFASMALRFGHEPASWVAADPAGDGESKQLFGPLVGGLRIFVVESLLGPGAGDNVSSLSQLLAGLAPATGEAVLAELLATGLDTAHDQALARLAKAYVERAGEPGTHVLARAATAAFRRLMASGRVVDAVAAAELAGRVVPTSDTVDLRSHATRYAAWTISAARAVELGRSLVADARAEGDADALVRALDALREALEASGVSRDDEEANALESELLALSKQPNVTSASAKIAAMLSQARRASERKDGSAREEAFAAATETAEAGKHRALAARVALARATAYADHALGLSRDVRRAAAHEAVHRACALGDPFLEAVACDVAAWVWHVDHSVQSTWIERGLVAASATSALAARARLLDRRGRISLAHGQAVEADSEAQESAALFDQVGHRRHALRTRLHVLAIAAMERGKPGDTKRWWTKLRREASTAELGAAFEEALLTLLEAGALCDVGMKQEARALLGELEALRVVHPKPTARINANLVLGRVELLEGHTDTACALWREAKAWGVETKFADFIYQPQLMIARAVFDEVQEVKKGATDPARLATSETARDSALDELKSLLENRELGSDNRDRYAGEIRTLLARGLLEKGSLEEAQSWLTDALAWFSAHPEHRAHAEALAIRALLFDAQRKSVKDADEDNKLAPPENSAGKGGRRPPSAAYIERNKLAGQADSSAGLARAAVAVQAKSFETPGADTDAALSAPNDLDGRSGARDSEAFTRNHPATALLARLEMPGA